MSTADSFINYITWNRRVTSRVESQCCITLQNKTRSVTELRAIYSHSVHGAEKASGNIIKQRSISVCCLRQQRTGTGYCLSQYRSPLVLNTLINNHLLFFCPPCQYGKVRSVFHDVDLHRRFSSFLSE